MNFRKIIKGIITGLVVLSIGNIGNVYGFEVEYTNNGEINSGNSPIIQSSYENNCKKGMFSKLGFNLFNTTDCGILPTPAPVSCSGSDFNSLISSYSTGTYGYNFTPLSDGELTEGQTKTLNGMFISSGTIVGEFTTELSCNGDGTIMFSAPNINCNPGYVQSANFGDTNVCISNIPQYPGCNTPDYTAPNGQIVSMCNAGSSVAGTGPANYGNYYQWGRNVTIGPLTIPGPLDWSSAHSTPNFITYINTPYDWFISPNPNLWGGSLTTLTSGVYSGQNVGDKFTMKGPCANGYHVPTVYEWKTLLENIKGSSISNNLWETIPNITTGLNIPLTGFRGSNGSYSQQGFVGNYTTATPFMGNSYFVRFNNINLVYFGAFYDRGAGFSLRCFKDN